MSDIAPFVAATLRDMTLLELMEENKKLREKNKKLNCVEITGPSGYPCYARAQFDDRDSVRVVDSDGPIDSDSSRGKPDWDDCFWELALEQSEPCRLEDLDRIEIWVGGSQRGGFCNNYRRRLVHYSESGTLTFAFSPGSFGLAVVTGWSKERLHASGLLPETNFDNMDGDELLEYVCSKVAQADPTRTCQFTTFGLPFRSNRGLIKTALH